MQTLGISDTARKPSTIYVLRTAIVDHGVSSIYTGLSASLLRQMSYSMVRLGSYDLIKQSLATDGHASNAQLLLAAGLAGGLGGVVGNPAGMLQTMCGTSLGHDLTTRRHSPCKDDD